VVYKLVFSSTHIPGENVPYTNFNRPNTEQYIHNYPFKNIFIIISNFYSNYVWRFVNTQWTTWCYTEFQIIHSYLSTYNSSPISNLYPYRPHCTLRPYCATGKPKFRQYFTEEAIICCTWQNSPPHQPHIYIKIQAVPWHAPLSILSTQDKLKFCTGNKYLDIISPFGTKINRFLHTQFSTGVEHTENYQSYTCFNIRN